MDSDGVLTFKTAPDYEAPASAASSNAYSVTVTATDGGSNTDTTDVTINVQDVNEAPVLNVDATSTVSATENSTTVATYSVTDADAGDTVSYSISGDDAGLFDIDSATGVLTFASAPDYETPGSAASSNAYSVTVTATDGGNNTDTTDVTINVRDVIDNSGSAAFSTVGSEYVGYNVIYQR